MPRACDSRERLGHYGAHVVAAADLVSSGRRVGAITKPPQVQPGQPSSISCARAARRQPSSAGGGSSAPQWGQRSPSTSSTSRSLPHARHVRLDQHTGSPMKTKATAPQWRAPCSLSPITAPGVDWLSKRARQADPSRNPSPLTSALCGRRPAQSREPGALLVSATGED